MKQVYTILLLCALLSQGAYAQVPKKNIVEHFTNTKCSICASRNPGFYSNLNGQSGLLHLAIHPSAPYNGCLLYQQNAAENDARTNYYGIYGSTPRLVINGNVVSPNADYADNAIFSPYQSQTSPAFIRIVQTKFGSDSIRSTVIVKTVAQHSLGALSLFVALAEDTVFYTGSNGEPRHYDVFRKALGSVTGVAVTLPATVGDSVVFTARATPQSYWNVSRINTMALLQESTTKNLVQAEKYSSPLLVTGISGNGPVQQLRIYPNPSAGIFTVETAGNKGLLEVQSATGQVILQKDLSEDMTRIDLSNQAEGLYFVSIVSGNKPVARQKLLLVR